MSKITPRIALFLRTLGGGGAERAHINLARGLIEAGIAVDLVLSAGEGLELWEIPSEVRVIDLKAARVSASLPSLIRYLRQEQPVAIIPTLHYAIEVAIVAKYLAGVSTKVLVPEQNNLSREVKYHEKGSRQRLIPLAVRFLYPLADCLVGVSRGVAEDLAQITGLSLERINVIYNPAFPELQEKAQEPIDHPWFMPGSPPVIISVGRLEDQKDYPTLIKAFAKVRAVCNARLMILGWGPDQSKLGALVAELSLTEHVEMPGFVKNPFPYMKKAAVFALSSRWEGMPNVIIEALTIGTPVVSTNCESGPTEILNDGTYGELVPVGDSQSLADALLKVLSGNIKSVSPDWLDQFSLKLITQQYLNVLQIGLSEGNIYESN
ncbi:glycosyl transferase [Pseudanabaena sp. SR411]|uniref:glycosyltransferase n=1 Tax=Pseudanabaena sp. SR411 TaxID=1980935 RepID=UPI000B99BF47|nr:glycosyltransferase [Pseudanabaena sp. SR411]OYQ63090.1 glycosyl transferase [Pseudanabaena sp. SR411]